MTSDTGHPNEISLYASDSRKVAMFDEAGLTLLDAEERPRFRFGTDGKIRKISKRGRSRPWWLW